MQSLQLLVPALLIAAACSSSSKNDEPESMLTEAEQAELQRIVDKRMAAVGSSVSLSNAQLEGIKPIMLRAKQQFIVASRAYRADPTPRNMDKYQSKMRDLGKQLRKDLQPHMTSGQLNQYLVVVDQVIQDVRAARVRGE